MQKIVGVRRDKDKTLNFFIQNIEDLKLQDKVVVDFDDFQTVAIVSKLGMTISDDKATQMKKIIRVATESDLNKYESLNNKAKAFLPEIKKTSLALGLMMKFVSAEYSLDGSKILIVFSSEERVDFRQLLKELAGMLKARIELKQIGQRDEVKICGAVGQCGQPCCCSRFLNDFEHVTVKMAKIQGLSLSPTKINGICGRLMCCLGYETSMYEEVIQKMPKVGAEINTPNGRGMVVYNDLLRERVSVKLKSEGDTFVVEDFSLEEINASKNRNFEEEKMQKEANFAENFIINGQISADNTKIESNTKDRDEETVMTTNTKSDLKQTEQQKNYYDNQRNGGYNKNKNFRNKNNKFNNNTKK